PKAFASRHWYACLRELNIRVRGIYCTKDTFVTTALQVGANQAWLESHTGVSYATLRRPHGKLMPREGESELQRFHAASPALFDDSDETKLSLQNEASEGQSSEVTEDEEDFECEEGDLNPHGCYPTSPSN